MLKLGDSAPQNPPKLFVAGYKQLWSAKIVDELGVDELGVDEPDTTPSQPHLVVLSELSVIVVAVVLVSLCSLWTCTYKIVRDDPPFYT